MKNKDSQKAEKTAKSTKTRGKVKRGVWPTLRAAKGYQDQQRNPLPDTPHVFAFLRAKPLARAIPHPVATPPLPPQEKIREIRRWLYWQATQKFPSAREYAATTISNADIQRLYGISPYFGRKEPIMHADIAQISAHDTEAQINQFFIRVITHAFKTWRHMLRIHREAREAL